MHLITLQEKANARQRDASERTQTLTDAVARAGVLLGASINAKTSKERQTEKGSTHNAVFTYVNRENYSGVRWGTRTLH